jgi:Rieske Fe-S protein
MCDCQSGCDSGVTRRDFLQSSTLAAVGALLATACGGRIDFGSGLSGPSGGLGAFTIRLSDYPTLASVGGMAVIGGAPVPMVAVRVDATTYAVFSLVCPHAGTTVAPAGAGFRCPNHGATWDSTGTWTGGQRTSGLTKLQASFDAAAGTLAVSGGGGNVDLTIKLANFPALAAVGGLARVDGNTSVPIGVARTGAAAYAAYGLACPHEQAIIDPTGNRWRCPKHGAVFAADGALLQGPALTGLTLLTTTLDPAAGTLHIRGSAVPGNPNTDD